MTISKTSTETVTTIKGFKAFKKGMVCRGFRFAEGETFEQSGRVDLCSKGFHFCENPLDVLNYYDLLDSEFAPVEALGVVETKGNKSATNKIKIGMKLGLPGFIKASFDFLWERAKVEPVSADTQVVDGHSSKVATSGDSSQVATSGDFSQVATSGDSSQVATSGDFSQVATSGDSSQVATSGDFSQVATSGDSSQVATSGYSSKVATSGDSSQVATSGYSSKVATSGDSSKVATSGYSSKVATSGDSSKVATSGYSSKVATSGDFSQVATSGDSSQVATSGDFSQVATSGHFSQVATSGDSSQVALNCNDSVGAAIGINNTIKGSIGCWITLAEYTYDYGLSRHLPLCVKSALIDGELLKADTWYKLANGEFVEVE